MFTSYHTPLFRTQTLNKWCLDFGLISKGIYELVISKHNETLKESIVEEIENKGIIDKGEERIIDDYTETIKGLQGRLSSTLNRMAKLNIIEYYLVFKGVKENGETVNLHEKTYERLLSIKRGLMEKYDVDDWYVSNYKNAKKTVAYMEKWKEALINVIDVDRAVLNLDYYYKTYTVILKARKKRITNYLQQYNKDMIEAYENNPETFLNSNEEIYHAERKGYVFDKAKEKEDGFFKPRKNEPKRVKEARKELGGKKKPFYRPMVEDFTFDEDYYRLYFERLYAKKIKELQEHYNFTFVNVSQCKLI